MTASRVKGFPRRNRWLRRDAARIAQRLPQLLDEVVVVFVRADPKPDDEIAVFLRNSAIVIADSYGPDISDKRFELH